MRARPRARESILFSESRGGDFHQLSVFGDGPSGEIFDAGLGQLLTYLVVTQRLCLVFGVDNALQLAPYGFPASLLTVVGFGATAEEFSER